MKVSISLSLVTSLFLIILSCNKIVASPQANEFALFEDHLLGIRFFYPSEWTIDNNNSNRVSLFHDSQISKPTIKLVLKNMESCEDAIECYRLPEIIVKVFKTDFPERFTSLEEYTREQITTIQSQIGAADSSSYGYDYGLVGLNATTLAGNVANMHIFTYTSTLLAYPADKHLMQMNVYMINLDSNNIKKLYNIGYLATQGHEYSKYLPAVQKILETFEIVPLIG